MQKGYPALMAIAFIAAAGALFVAGAFSLAPAKEAGDMNSAKVENTLTATAPTRAEAQRATFALG